MSDPRRRFDPSELEGGNDAERAGLLATARDLEWFARNETGGPTAGFEDRVMAAIAAEPPPRALVGRGILVAVRDAWHLAWTGGRPLAVRAQAFALLLIVAIGVGSLGTVAAVGVGQMLRPSVTPPPTILPSPSPSVATPSPTPSVAPSPSPTPTPSITPSPAPTPSATGTDEPSGTDDHGGGSSSGSGSETERPEDHSGSDHETSEPSEDSSGHGSGEDETPEPTETPHD
jgi:hypothetical protein